jgi:hypothetical protein
MKLVPTLTAVVTCLSAYTSAALAADVASEAATESADPSLSGILPAEESSAKGNGNEASPDEVVSGKTAKKHHGREAKNAIYVDLLGPGVVYSLNYDREIFDDVSARIGISYLSVSASDGLGESAASSYLSIPITASYLGIGSKSNMLEVGGGVAIISYKGEAVVDTEGAEEDGTLLAMTALVGYRHQPADGGFVFRVGLSPMMVFSSGFLPWGYLSLGAAF